MIKKTQILMMLLLAGSLTAWSQGDKGKYTAHGRAYNAEDTAVVNGKHGAGWIRSHLFDDWFIEVQGGGQLYYGTDDRKGAFGDRLTGNAEFQFGRRIFPMFGFRGGIGYGYAHGFLSKDLLSSVNLGPGVGRSGEDPATGSPLGGYYYDYNDDLLIQKWKYYYAGLDLFLDLDIFRGAKNYNPYRKWNNIVYGGVHTRFGLSELELRNHRSEAHVGYIGKYNITRKLGVFVDARVSFIERLFDREWVESVETPGFAVDHIANLQVGVIYKFHVRSEDERSAFERTDRNSDLLAHSHFTYLKMEETYTMSLIDTLLKYEQVNSPTPEMQKKIQDLRDSIEADNDRRKRNLDGQPLDSILLNQLLPYEMVFFELDKWDILPSEEMKIDKMARIMKAYPNETFVLTGSADSKTGTVKRNIFLSHNRADVVYNKLVNEYGIPESQLRREYLGGILDYQPFYLNRCTVIIMDHPVVQEAFNKMKAEGRAGGGEVEF